MHLNFPKSHTNLDSCTSNAKEWAMTKLAYTPKGRWGSNVKYLSHHHQRPFNHTSFCQQALCILSLKEKCSLPSVQKVGEKIDYCWLYFRWEFCSLHMNPTQNEVTSEAISTRRRPIKLHPAYNATLNKIFHIKKSRTNANLCRLPGEQV